MPENTIPFDQALTAVRPFATQAEAEAGANTTKAMNPLRVKQAIAAQVETIHGEDGKSAYEIWIEEGNSGTEEDFLDSLKGADGEPGEDGLPGEKGEKGDDGAPGINYFENDIYVPADAWVSRQTNGATWQVDETATNDQCESTMVFSPTTEQAMQWKLRNLKNQLFLTDSFKLKIHSKISGSTLDANSGVVWGIRAAFVTDSLDVNWNTDAAYNTTLVQAMTSLNNAYHTDYCDVIKAAGTLANNCMLLFEIYRKVSDAGDTMNVSAAILDVEIMINQ